MKKSRTPRVRSLAAFSAALSAFALLSCQDDATQCADAECSSSTGSGGSGGQNTAAVCPPSGLLRGPWAVDASRTSAVVRFDACAANASSEVLFAEESGGLQRSATGALTESLLTTRYDPGLFTVRPDLPGTMWTGEVALTGLVPGTCYRYSLAAEPSLQGRICTTREATDTLNIVAIGDTNPGIGPTKAVLDVALAARPDFSIHLGDIQYYTSIVDTWTDWMPRMQPLLSAGVFYPALGNHEFEIEGEFEDYYLRMFRGTEQVGTDEYYRFESGGVWFFSLDTETDMKTGSPQAEWFAASIDEVSKRPDYRFSVVFMHRPLITVGDSDQHPEEREQLLPIFKAHDVRLVLAGHMHGYERFVIDGITFVTSGGGGGLMGDINENVEERPLEAALRVAFAPAYHAMGIRITPSELKVVAVDDEGKVIDAYVEPVP